MAGALSFVPVPRSPLTALDHGVLCLTLERAVPDDGDIIEFGAILSGLVQCSTVVVVHGEGQDAVAIVLPHKLSVQNSGQSQRVRFFAASCAVNGAATQEY